MAGFELEVFTYESAVLPVGHKMFDGLLLYLLNQLELVRAFFAFAKNAVCRQAAPCIEPKKC